MLCNNCGKEIADSSRFCGFCGATVPPAAEPAAAEIVPPAARQPGVTTDAPEKKKKKKSSKKFKIAISLILIATILLSSVVYFAFFRKETIYVMVSQIYYDQDGTPHRRVDWKYDEAGQVLRKEVDYGIMETVYDEKLDVYSYSVGKYDGTVDQSYEYEYDEYGNLTEYEYTYENGHQHIAYEYEYDKDGQIQSFEEINLPSENSSMEKFSNTFECAFDEDGNLTGIVLPATEQFPMDRQRVSYEYDREGRLETEYFFHKEAIYRQEFIYKDGKLACIEMYTGPNIQDTDYHLQSSVEFEYDKEDRLEKKIFFDKEGNETSEVRYKFDKDGYLKEQINVDPDSGEKSETSYSCDENGNITKIKNSDGSWVKCEYEALKVTDQQAAYFRRRNGIKEGTQLTFYRPLQDTPLYYMVPNPLWDLIWIPKT